jgi:glycerol-3-phosphate acyltransferase PlsX
MPIILDMMGSDKYPDPEIQAAIIAAKELKEEIILVGDTGLYEKKIKELGGDSLPLTYVFAPDVIEMDDKPVEGTRLKPNNSMAVGIKLIKEGKGQAFVTAGNTGAAMFNAIRTLGRIEGVQRPALSAIFPTKTGRCIVLDIGANVDCRPEFLYQFAILGSIYAEKVLGKQKPRVGLLSNGEEPGKGNQLIKDTFPLIEKSGLNFIGNVEGKELFGGEADVVVTDGFVGNVLVKSSEAVSKLITDILKQELMSTFFTKIGAMLAKPAFSKIKKLVDPSEVGAAPLLGINGLVFVGHGRSDSRAIVSAIRLAHQTINLDLLTALQKGIKEKIIQ